MLSAGAPTGSQTTLRDVTRSSAADERRTVSLRDRPFGLLKRRLIATKIRQPQRSLSCKEGEP